MKQITEFFSKFSEKEKKILYVAVVFLVLAMVDRMFFGPVLSEIKRLDEELTEEEVSAKRDMRLLAYKDRILEEDNAFSAYYQTGKKTEEEIIAAFLKSVEILATQSRVTLIKVTPDKTVEDKGFIEYFAKLECTGPLDNMLRFMHAIDSSNDMLRVVTFSVTPKKSSDQDVQVSMSVVKKIISKTSEDIVIEKKLSSTRNESEKAKDESKMKDDPDSKSSNNQDPESPPDDHEVKPSVFQKFMNKLETQKKQEGQ